MTDRFIYVITAIALASVLIFDKNFSANLFRAFGEPTATMSLNPWAAGVGGVFMMLLVAALCREWRR